jgi:hypothetical protein
MLAHTIGDALTTDDDAWSWRVIGRRAGISAAAGGREDGGGVGVDATSTHSN